MTEHQQIGVGGRELHMPKPGVLGMDLLQLARLCINRKQRIRKMRIKDAIEIIVLLRVFSKDLSLLLAGLRPRQQSLISIQRRDAAPEIGTVAWSAR